MFTRITYQPQENLPWENSSENILISDQYYLSWNNKSQNYDLKLVQNNSDTFKYNHTIIVNDTAVIEQITPDITNNHLILTKSIQPICLREDQDNIDDYALCMAVFSLHFEDSYLEQLSNSEIALLHKANILSNNQLRFNIPITINYKPPRKSLFNEISKFFNKIFNTDYKKTNNMMVNVTFKRPFRKYQEKDDYFYAKPGFQRGTNWQNQLDKLFCKRDSILNTRKWSKTFSQVIENEDAEIFKYNKNPAVKTKSPMRIYCTKQYISNYIQAWYLIGYSDRFNGLCNKIGAISKKIKFSNL